MENIKISNNKYGNLCVLEDGTVIEFPLSWYNMLEEALKDFRSDNSKLVELPAYCVFPNKTLDSIINVLPRNKRYLWLVDGFNDILIDTYGSEIVKIVDSFLKEHKVVDILYSKKSFEIKNQRVKSILGFLGVLDEIREEK